MSRPEIRRLRKFYEKYYPNGYLSKIKRLLQNPRRDEISSSNSNQTTDLITSPSSPGRIPNNKHIIPADAICVNKQLGVGEFGIVQQGVWTNGTERVSSLKLSLNSFIYFFYLLLDSSCNKMFMSRTNAIKSNGIFKRSCNNAFN